MDANSKTYIRIKGLIQSLALFFGSILFVLVCAEMFLTAIRFSYTLYLGKVQFGAPTPVQMSEYYLFDKDLFWVPKNYYKDIKAAENNNPSIAFIGDSCTQYGKYHEYLAGLISERTSGRKVRYLNCGVVGWSSYQGLQQLKRDVLDLRPKIVTIYYGWNDHWLGYGVEDKDVATLNACFISRFQRSRFIQLIMKTRVLILRKMNKMEIIPQRVSPEDYRHNLREMVIIARARGIVPVLLTAPSSHEKGKEPARLKERWLEDVSDLIPLHRKYNSIVRDVAADEGAVLCDLDMEFKALSKDDVRNKYFAKDGVHPTEEGDRKIAGFLYNCFERNALLEKISPPGDDIKKLK